MKSSSVDLQRSLRWVNFFISTKKTITKLISSYTHVSDVFRCRSTGSTNKRVITKIIINFILNALNLLFVLSRAVSAPPSRGLRSERERKLSCLVVCCVLWWTTPICSSFVVPSSSSSSSSSTMGSEQQVRTKKPIFISYKSYLFRLSDHWKYMCIHRTKYLFLSWYNQLF